MAIYSYGVYLGGRHRLRGKASTHMGTLRSDGRGACEGGEGHLWVPPTPRCSLTGHLQLHLQSVSLALQRDGLECVASGIREVQLLHQQ